MDNPKATLLLFMTGEPDEQKQAAYDYNDWVSKGGFKAEVLYEGETYKVRKLDRDGCMYLANYSQFEDTPLHVSINSVRIVK